MENEANVEKPPKNPTIKNIRITSDISLTFPIKKAATIPISKQPKMFTINVPIGKFPSLPASNVVMKYRNIAPSPPPKNTTKIFSNLYTFKTFSRTNSAV